MIRKAIVTGLMGLLSATPSFADVDIEEIILQLKEKGERVENFNDRKEFVNTSYTLRKRTVPVVYGENDSLIVDYEIKLLEDSEGNQTIEALMTERSEDGNRRISYEIEDTDYIYWRTPRAKPDGKSDLGVGWNVSGEKDRLVEKKVIGLGSEASQALYEWIVKKVKE